MGGLVLPGRNGRLMLAIRKLSFLCIFWLFMCPLIIRIFCWGDLLGKTLGCFSLGRNWFIIKVKCPRIGISSQLYTMLRKSTYLEATMVKTKFNWEHANTTILLMVNGIQSLTWNQQEVKVVLVESMTIKLLYVEATTRKKEHLTLFRNISFRRINFKPFRLNYQFP